MVLYLVWGTFWFFRESWRILQRGHTLIYGVKVTDEQRKKKTKQNILKVKGVWIVAFQFLNYHKLVIFSYSPKNIDE